MSRKIRWIARTSHRLILCVAIKRHKKQRMARFTFERVNFTFERTSAAFAICSRSTRVRFRSRKLGRSVDDSCRTFFRCVSGKNRVYISCDFYARVRHEDHRLRLRGSSRRLSSKRLEHIRLLDSSDRVSTIAFHFAHTVIYGRKNLPIVTAVSSY